MRGDAVNNLNNLLDFANGMISTNNRTGFFAGMYTTLPIGSSISLEPALYYSQKGYGLKGSLNIKGLDFLGVNARAQLQSQYIDIPVLLKTSIGELQLYAGPQLSYLVKADVHTSAGALGFNVVNSHLDATSQFSRWDAAMTAGIGYQFQTGFNVMAAYDYGLTRVDANRNMNSYNRSFKVGIGMSF